MSVVRTVRRIFEVPHTDMIACVQRVLSNSALYSSTRLDLDGSFSTLITPQSPWLLRTTMTVKVEEADLGSSVTVSTRSQVLVLGDIFNMYDAYIRAFFKQLEAYAGDKSLTPLLLIDDAYKSGDRLNWQSILILLIVAGALAFLGFTDLLIGSTGLRWILSLFFGFLLLSYLLQYIRDFAAHRHTS